MAKKNLGVSFLFKHIPLLFENGVEDFDIYVKDWTSSVPYFLKQEIKVACLSIFLLQVFIY